MDSEVQARGKLKPGYEQFYNGTLGGRIVRDRTFFFTSWQEQRQRGGNQVTSTVLSAAGRNRLRELFPQGANPRADLYLNVTQGVEATGQFTNQELGDGRGALQFGTGVVSFPLQVNGRQSLNKVDHRFSDRDLISFRYGFDQTVDPTANTNFPGFFTSTRQKYNNALVTHTHIFSPSVTNELRVPFSRIEFEFPIDAANPLAATLPRYTLTPISALGLGTTLPQGRIANNYTLQDTLNWVSGKHSLRFGFDLLQQRSRQYAPSR
ncbi:MAG: hypothetical protein WKF37_00325 [Bryobacteraceae bacterium]